MKSILIHAANDEYFDSRLQIALDIVRCVNGHLTLVQAQPYQGFVAVDMFGGTHLLAQALEASSSAQAELRARVDADFKNEGLSWSWQQYDGDTGAVIADAARLCDLIIMSLGETGSMGANPNRALVGEVALATRAPVLAIPGKINSMKLDRAMLAYDGGMEATNALRAALPLLKLAKSVCFAEIEEKQSEFPITDAAVYLSRHGVESEIVTKVANSKAIEECLLDTVQQWQPDYMVMGAYGHGRLRETLFGGVTRYLLGETKIPLLLAH